MKAIRRGCPAQNMVDVNAQFAVRERTLSAAAAYLEAGLGGNWKACHASIRNTVQPAPARG
jgi:hypothetical protein